MIKWIHKQTKIIFPCNKQNYKLHLYFRLLLPVSSSDWLHPGQSTVREARSQERECDSLLFLFIALLLPQFYYSPRLECRGRGEESRARKFLLNWWWCKLRLAPFRLGRCLHLALSLLDDVWVILQTLSPPPPLMHISNPSLFQLAICFLFHTLRVQLVYFWPPFTEISSRAGTKTTPSWLSVTLPIQIWSMGNVTSLVVIDFKGTDFSTIAIDHFLLSPHFLRLFKYNSDTGLLCPPNCRNAY